MPLPAAKRGKWPGWENDRKTAIRFVTRALALKHDVLTPDLYDELFAKLSAKKWMLVKDHRSAISGYAWLYEFTALNATDVDDLIAGKKRPNSSNSSSRTASAKQEKCSGSIGFALPQLGSLVGGRRAELPGGAQFLLDGGALGGCERSARTGGRGRRVIVELLTHCSRHLER